MKTKSKFYKKNEFYIACLIFLLAFFIEMRSGLYFTCNDCSRNVRTGRIYCNDIRRL